MLIFTWIKHKVGPKVIQTDNVIHHLHTGPHSPKPHLESYLVKI